MKFVKTNFLCWCWGKAQKIAILAATEKLQNFKKHRLFIYPEWQILVWNVKRNVGKKKIVLHYIFSHSLHFLPVYLYILKKVCLLSNFFRVFSATSLPTPLFRVCCLCARLHLRVTVLVQIKEASRHISDCSGSSHPTPETQVLCLGSTWAIGKSLDTAPHGLEKVRASRWKATPSNRTNLAGLLLSCGESPSVSLHAERG